MKPSDPGREHPHCGRMVIRRAQAGDHAPQGLGRVGSQFGIGDPGLLEIEHVEEVVAEQHAKRLRRRDLGAWHRRNAQTDHGRDPIGMQLRRAPHHRGAPVVTDEHRPLGADVVEQADHVGGQLGDVVVGDGLGPAGAAIAALIRSQYVVPGGREHRDLVTP